MSIHVSIFTDYTMLVDYSDDDTYSNPVMVGTINSPLNGLIESVTSAFPIWIKNTGSDKIFSVKLLASDGIISVEGGTKSTTDDAYIELALDNNSNLPNAQSVSPSTFTGASSSEDSPEILITNAVTTSNIGKSITELSADDDARTLMPNEYAIVWIRGHIRDITAPGGALPTSAGIKNIRFTVNAKTLGV